MSRPPKSPEDMVLEPPIPCDFKVGDPVVYTNDYGVQFDLTIFGFAAEPHNKEFPDSPQRFVYCSKDSWWFPVAVESLAHRVVPPKPAGQGEW